MPTRTPNSGRIWHQHFSFSFRKALIIKNGFQRFSDLSFYLLPASSTFSVLSQLQSVFVCICVSSPHLSVSCVCACVVLHPCRHFITADWHYVSIFSALSLGAPPNQFICNATLPPQTATTTTPHTVTMQILGVPVPGLRGPHHILSQKDIQQSTLSLFQFQVWFNILIQVL